MPPRTTRTPPFVRTITDDLKKVSRLLFIDFLGSVLLWPLVLVISILLIPLTLLGRWLLLHCCLPCTCRRLCCSCREFATATESSYIDRANKISSYKVLHTRIHERWRAEANTTPIEATSEPLVSPTSPESPADPAELITENIHSLVLIVEQSLDVEKLTNLIHQRITDLSVNDGGKKYFARFTQCLVRLPGGSHVWVNDPTFSLSRHIVECNEMMYGQVDLQQLLHNKSREGLISSRPLWQLIIAKEYGCFKDTVLMWRFHGAIYDGVTIAKVLAFALGNPQNFPYRANNQYYLHKNHVLQFFVTGPIRFLRLLLKKRGLGTAGTTVDNGEVTHQHSWSERTLNLSVVLKNKMLLNMSCNDLLLAMMTGALKGHHPNKRSDVTSPTTHLLPRKCNVLVPFDLWANLKHRKTLPRGNCLTMLPCDISVVPEVMPRLWRTERIFSKLKKSGDTRVHLYFMNWLHCLPFTHCLIRYLNRRLRVGSAAVFTSFNGPKVIESIVGAEIRDIMFFTYPPSGIPCSFNFLSYSGTVKLTTMSSVELSSNTVDSIICNMAAQLSEVNRMVFQRYFPDGLGGDVCPYVQPHASKLFTEFIAKLQEIDAMSRNVYPSSQPQSTATPYSPVVPSTENSPATSGNPSTVIPVAPVSDMNSTSPEEQPANVVNGQPHHSADQGYGQQQVLSEATTVHVEDIVIEKKEQPSPKLMCQTGRTDQPGLALEPTTNGTQALGTPATTPTRKGEKKLTLSKDKNQSNNVTLIPVSSTSMPSDLNHSNGDNPLPIKTTVTPNSRETIPNLSVEYIDECGDTAASNSCNDVDGVNNEAADINTPVKASTQQVPSPLDCDIKLQPPTT